MTITTTKQRRWLLLGAAATWVSAAAGAAGATWTAYGGAPGGGQYSEATLISKSNVKNLKPVWVTHTGELAKGWARSEKLTFEANPVLAEGRLYLSAATGVVLALDPANGRVIWRADAHIDGRTHFGELASRGVASWVDTTAPATATCRHRIVLGTIDARLMAFDGATGQPCVSFGKDGVVDLRQGIHLRDPGDFVVTSPPAIVGGTVVVGSAIGDNRAARLEEGVVRAYDVRTGAPLWAWDPLADGGSKATRSSSTASSQRDGSSDDAARQSGAANVWAPMAVDVQRGWVFLPTSSPSPDFYGGQRPGANRDASSVVAVEAQTGRVVWRRQLVHHDLWDYDLASQPVLATILVGGRPRDVVLQGSKMGFVFVLDRDNGEFVFRVDERQVPPSDVPGEQAWPTQPFPSAWLQLANTAPVNGDSAWGFTPLDKLACQRKMEGLRNQGIYTPPSRQGTLMLPGYAGGINWGGLTFDPVRQILLAPVLQVPMVVTLIDRAPTGPTPTNADRERFPGSEFAKMEGTPYALRREALLSPLGAPCTAPPWGKMVAIDMTGQRRLWERPIGDTSKLAPVALDLGVPFSGGAIATASGLVFMAGTTDQKIRAYDIDTGAELWRDDLPAGGQATPMTYVHQGRQYVVVAAGGHGGLGTQRGDAVVAYALP